MADPSDLPALRLELLRLVHRHDHTPEQLIARAAVLEAWLLEGAVRPARATPTRG